MGLDLLDFFRGIHPWTKLYRILAKLPQGSWYRADLDLDPDLAKRLFDIEEQQRARNGGDSRVEEPRNQVRSSAGHDMTASLLMTVCDLLQQQTQTLIGVNLPKGKRPPKIHPMPRPISKLEVMRREREEDSVNEALSALGI